MVDVSNRRRVPKGTPDGGKFAKESNGGMDASDLGESILDRKREKVLGYMSDALAGAYGPDARVWDDVEVKAHVNGKSRVYHLSEAPESVVDALVSKTRKSGSTRVESFKPAFRHSPKVRNTVGRLKNRFGTDFPWAAVPERDRDTLADAREQGIISFRRDTIHVNTTKEELRQRLDGLHAAAGKVWNATDAGEYDRRERSIVYGANDDELDGYAVTDWA